VTPEPPDNRATPVVAAIPSLFPPEAPGASEGEASSSSSTHHNDQGEHPTNKGGATQQAQRTEEQGSSRGARRLLPRIGRAVLRRARRLKPGRQTNKRPHRETPAETTSQGQPVDRPGLTHGPGEPSESSAIRRQGIDPRSAAARKIKTSSRDLATQDQRARSARGEPLPTLEHAGWLPDLPGIPPYLLPEALQGTHLEGRMSCGFCGVGDSGVVRGKRRPQGDGAPDRAGGRVGRRSPTKGCAKLQVSAGELGTLFPIHTAPSVLWRYARDREQMTYEESIERFADLVLDHRDPDTQILVYGCGQIDYFTIFAMQEVFRLLGVRNIAGNAEHCLNAGAVHNEMLTGQEGPFLTFDSAFDGSNRFFILNGWNGQITHPGAWHRMLGDKNFDGYLIDVMESESAQTIGRRFGRDRVVLIRSGGDPHLALGVAHQILTVHPEAIEERFIDQFADQGSWEAFSTLAASDDFSPGQVADRIAPEPQEVPRIEAAIKDIAARIAAPEAVPINIPSVGLSQTKGAVSHCLWGCAMAMVGKYGLKADGSAAGGTLRVPGQINAQSEVQALSRLFFFGRIPVDDQGAVEAARRMGLPDDSYELAVRDQPRAVLDYSDPATRFDRQLIIAFGTQFEANMMDRDRWLEKLKSEGTTLVVVDPIPDPYTLDNAHLVIPSPPHSATPKLYQNGEWRLTLSAPRRQMAPETRSDATILYDMMAVISRRIREDSMLRMVHPDLGFHSQSGYLRERFEDPADGGGLPRYGGEVSRAHLWQRVLDYMDDGPGRSGPLYCRPVDDSGAPITWTQLVEDGDQVYGGVGTSRYRLDYDSPGHSPFGDIYERPYRFRFFIPTEQDLELPTGIVLNSGRSALSENPADLRYAIHSFNSGKATPATGMPEEHPLYISPMLAEQEQLECGDKVLVQNTETTKSVPFQVQVTERLRGQLAYIPFHKDRAQLDHGRYLNNITSQAGRCPYTAQSNFKLTSISIERLEAESTGPRDGDLPSSS